MSLEKLEDLKDILVEKGFTFTWGVYCLFEKDLSHLPGDGNT